MEWLSAFEGRAWARAGYGAREKAAERKMSRTRWIWVGTAALLVGLGAWRWLRHGETQAEEGDRSSGGDAVTAAVVRAERGAMEQNSAATTAQVVLAVDQSFYNALETKALLEVAQQTIDVRQLIANKVSALTQAKLKSDLDLSFAQVDLSMAKLLELEGRNNYQAALARLSAILG